MSIIQPEDYHKVVAKPDPNFSPARNKAIINETIKDTEAYFAKLGKVINDELGNRIDIFSSYGVYRFNKGDKNFDKYAGKRLVSQLIGEKILSKIRVAEEANKLGARNNFITL